jgi:hypothetical protein
MVSKQHITRLNPDLKVGENEKVEFLESLPVREIFGFCAKP